jgi:hypothetical protein
MYRQGVRFEAATPLIQVLVDEGVGCPACATVEEKPAGKPHGSLFRSKPGKR